MPSKSSKSWHKEHNKLRYADPAYREAAIKRARETNKRNKAWLDEYKISRGCFFCGMQRAAALHFHHIKGKKYDVSTLKGASIKKIREEISKCEVVCANCHALLHEADRVR